ncbi:hypothetical protein EVAR_10577_1 [Eumeta japonica]|uniref:Uncharacterized protein n=1 Tax=Eumeta variegata TaxID=151549 RepID=A0A4C1U3A9_EUMVA|nr:hypothetical protein EVAR_10577_1 [Eumeta japonica]
MVNEHATGGHRPPWTPATPESLLHYWLLEIKRLLRGRKLGIKRTGLEHQLSKWLSPDLLSFPIHTHIDFFERRISSLLIKNPNHDSPGLGNLSDSKTTTKLLLT